MTEEERYIDPKQIWSEMNGKEIDPIWETIRSKPDLSKIKNVNINSEHFLEKVGLFMKEVNDEGIVKECISIDNIKMIIDEMLKG